MPELPEVETIRRGLEKYIVGYIIEAIEVRMAKQFKGDITKAVGGTILGVRRFGKGLVIDLDNGYSIAIHVKMTGQLLYEQHETENVKHETVGKLPNKYTHGVFELRAKSPHTGDTNYKALRDKKARLYYNDLRQFGWIHVVKTSDIPEMPFFKMLGPEPLKDLTLQQFSTIIAASKLPIKLVLLDQAKIAGIGNIYANDALYRAKIHPSRSAKRLSLAEIEVLFESVEAVLRKGIEAGGASERDYVDVLGGKGGYQNFFLIYNKAGKPCQQCGATIERMKLGGRGTFFCPTCQQDN